MRILFKTPHQVFFRRCFFVSNVETITIGGKDFLCVVHGRNGLRETRIPLEGTVLRFIGV